MVIKLTLKHANKIKNAAIHLFKLSNIYSYGMYRTYRWIHPDWDHPVAPAKCQTGWRPVDLGGESGLAPAAKGPSGGTRTPYLAPPDAHRTLDAWTLALQQPGHLDWGGEQRQD